MSIGQFVLGLVTIFVATVVYRWQKTVDRETVALAEQKKLIAEYSAALNALFFSQPYRDQTYTPEEIQIFMTISESEQECYALRDQIFMTSSEEIVRATDELDKSFREWKIAYTKHLKCAEGEEKPEIVKQKTQNYLSSHRAFIAAARKDIGLHSSTRIVDVMRSMFFGNP